ncbi:hypothetical protein IQ285_32365 [Burkholderia sp. R-69608]|uniref:hypothetical protein n=1 Tax=Paraburkholderia nemoris TaxID=2793076 RepID=UPI0019147B49|nr:hypothetical protein [Paraburkholderia nemoris]MBK5152395.1 hypothetical protein [Burkholderia sp. R-69608]
MAHHALIQLSTSEGIGRFILFEGLDHAMLVKPTVYGSPVLTAQAIYFLEQMESVAHVRGERALPPVELEYIVDNYLFEFAKRHPETRMTFRITEGRFWEDDFSSMYNSADQMFTETLALDQLNDPSVLEIRALNPADDIDLNDWNIGVNHANSVLTEYVENVSALLQKKVMVRVLPSELRDGYFGKLRVIKPHAPYIDVFQAIALEDVHPDLLGANSDRDVPARFRLLDTTTYGCETELGIEQIYATKRYTPILLSHFFSGVKERNPLKAYLAYYNVLEYYFEEAPALLLKSVRTELEQLKCVLELLTTEADITAKLSSAPADTHTAITSPLLTSVGPAIHGVDQSKPSLRDEFARWLYEIRCAVVHSKKTRRGSPTSGFEPYSATSSNVTVGIQIVRWLAILCIEKDYDLTNPSHP